MGNKQLFVVLLVVSVALVLLGYFVGGQSRRVDCTIAEFSPDTTVAEKQYCRERRISLANNISR